MCVYVHEDMGLNSTLMSDSQVHFYLEIPEDHHSSYGVYLLSSALDRELVYLC